MSENNGSVIVPAEGLPATSGNEAEGEVLELVEVQVTKEELQTTALNLYEQALLLQVIDQATFDRGGILGAALKNLKGQIEGTYVKAKQSAQETINRIRDLERQDLAPVVEALATLSESMNGWLREDERKRKQLEALQRAQAALTADNERKRLLTEATSAEQSGDHELAAVKQEQAEQVYAMPALVPSAVKTASDNAYAQGELTYTMLDLDLFVAELVRRGMKVSGILQEKKGPLKSWLKTNHFQDFPGLKIERAPAVRFKK